MVEWVCQDCGSANDGSSMRCVCGYGGRLPDQEVKAQSSSFAERHSRADLDRLCGKDPNYQAMIQEADNLKHLSREELVAMAKGHAAEWAKNVELGRKH